jgi:hypothetical protein
MALMTLNEKCGALYVSKLTTNNNKLSWIAIWLLKIACGRQNGDA